MISRILRGFYILFFAALLACTGNNSSSVAQSNIDYIILNAKWLDVEEGTWKGPSDIYISAGKISDIKEIGKADAYPDSLKIDASGKYLVPGLAEMHAHIPVGDRELTEETLFLYLSNGVTTIRGMLGAPEHLTLRKEEQNNEILSPRIFTSGPSINGNTAPNPQVARKMVIDQERAGYDFLKMHPGISMETFQEINRTADSVGIEYSGHVSVWVGIEEALNGPYASIDHLDGYFEGLVPDDAQVKVNQNGFFGFNFTEIVSTEKIDFLAKLSRENDVWVVPTHCLLQRWVGPEDPTILGNQPEMKYMSNKTMYNWISSKKRFMSGSGYSIERANTFLNIRDSILYGLYKNGVGLLLGSDAPQVFNVPGFSIQHELKAMVDAGIPEIDIIRSGTLNPAKFFEKEGNFGEILIGSSADLIILSKDPLKDISSFRNIHGVFVKGRWLDESFIDLKLESIASKYDEEK